MRAGVRAAAAIAALLTACVRTSTETNGKRHPWTIPGVLRYAVSADPKNLNPALYPIEPTLTLSNFIYSYAVRYDGRARPVPDALREIPTIANGDVSRDGLLLKYKLRRNIRWQDGPQLTCDDLKFTWQAVMNPHNNVPSTDGYNDIAGIDCSDPYVAVVRMRRLYAPFLQELWGPDSGTPILPAHILAKYNDAKGSFDSAPYNSLPIGSGPFKIVDWKRGQEVRLRANPNFYLGAPHLREVVFRILPAAEYAAQLHTHEIDLLGPSSQMDWPTLSVLAKDPRLGLAATRVDRFSWTHVDFNLTRALFEDRSVRVALAYATDRNEINTKLYHGLPLASDTDQQPALSWAYTSQVVHYPHDLRKAQDILERDGWSAGPDGIRVKRGRRLEIIMSACTDHPGEVASEELLQQQWRKAGVQVEIKNYSGALFYDVTSTGILQGGHYDVAISSSRSGPDPDHSTLYSGDELPPRGYNTLFWRNRKATDAMNAALRTVDQTARKRYYAIAQRELTLDVPTIIIGFMRSPVLYNSDLQGFDVSPVTLFWDPWKYSI